MVVRGSLVLVAVVGISGAACGTLTDDKQPDDFIAEPGSVDAAGDALPDAVRVGVPDAATPMDAPEQLPDAVSPPDALGCVEGDLQRSDPDTGHCYMLFAAAETWTDAIMRCAELPGRTHLAVITSASEDAIVASFGVYGSVPDAWLGGTDAITEGQWVWITGEPMTDYTHWRAGEPNNSGTENCMIIELDTPAAEWDDRPCDINLYHTICEREAAGG